MSAPSTKRALLVLSHAMERAFGTDPTHGSDAGLVLAMFQHREHFDAEQERYAALAAVGHTVVVAFSGASGDLPPGVHAVVFERDDPRVRDWVLALVLGPYASALVAHDQQSLAAGELSLEGSRVFAARWTFRRPDALAAARTQLARLADLPPDVLAAPVAHLDRSASLPVSAVQERLASALDHLVGSVDAGHRRSSRLRVALEDSRGRAERDQLTGLHNRHFLQRFLGPVDRPMDLLALLVDVDDLKSANDRHGHAAGDAVLRAIALVLRRSSRPGTSSCAGAATSSSCWSRASSRAPAWPSPSGWPLPCAPPARRAPGTNLPLSASIGVCAVSRSTLPLDRLDGALAVVKRGGKGRAALAPGGAALRPV